MSIPTAKYRRFLKAALDVDSHQVLLGKGAPLERIARVCGISLETARVMVKQMVEEGLAHTPYGQDEPCLNQDEIEERLEQEPEMRDANLVVKAPSLPPNYEDIARGMALKHGVTIAAVYALAKEVTLKVSAPSPNEEAFLKSVGAFAAELEAELAVAVSQAAIGPLTINVQGNLTAGAVGQNASVSHSKVEHVTTTAGESAALAELALLLGQLLDEATQKQVTDYATLGRVQEAKEAAEKGDRTFVQKLLDAPIAKKIAALAADTGADALIDKLPVLIARLTE